MSRAFSSPPRLQLRLAVAGDVAVGPGKIALLEAIERHGSIAAACREMGLSYKKAWRLIETMNRHLERPVLETRAGGSQRGGAVVTSSGQVLVARYRALTQAVAALPEAEQLVALMALPDATDATDDTPTDDASST
ncbi:winged helix-turn-helix domain-containing protein [Salinicola aestuarinus]|uniref:winged helix-turn-helix domain-containing protein n=1 Tax=Salinicola aestuarinus TaxID=1949082 RepID=UPI000DA26737|nr:winged helix-turn-helix domain-containing protein [Salinicola aestuarinus]